MKKRSTPKRLQQTIRHDPVNAEDFLKYKLPWACEDCSHFDHVKKECTFGYNSRWHLRATQEQSYFLNGKMALCRFQEID